MMRQVMHTCSAGTGMQLTAAMTLLIDDECEMQLNVK